MRVQPRSHGAPVGAQVPVAVQNPEKTHNKNGENPTQTPVVPNDPATRVRNPVTTRANGETSAAKLKRNRHVAEKDMDLSLTIVPAVKSRADTDYFSEDDFRVVDLDHYNVPAADLDAIQSDFLYVGYAVKKTVKQLVTTAEELPDFIPLARSSEYSDLCSNRRDGKPGIGSLP
ncbi:hypothetical protein R1sor_005863 [Riccia sorocarpa]|uniref:Uncharacterized protein n=1 Tax=Riccia sorocarpa TaxID=122646 RepID=A0ABD3HNR1_9MARC